MQNVTHEIEGVGEFRAKAGTAVSELAGAASYWANQAKLHEKANKSKWRAGFLTGVVSSASIGFLILTCYRLFL